MTSANDIRRIRLAGIEARTKLPTTLAEARAARMARLLSCRTPGCIEPTLNGRTACAIHDIEED